MQDDNYIEEFVREEFPTEERVNISEMLKWAQKSEAVATFFRLIHQEVERDPDSVLAEKIYLRLERPKSDLHFASTYHYIKQEQFML